MLLASIYNASSAADDEWQSCVFATLKLELLGVRSQSSKNKYASEIVIIFFLHLTLLGFLFCFVFIFRFYFHFYYFFSSYYRPYPCCAV